MIQALFGLPDIALRTLEVYTSGDARGVARAGAAAARRSGATCMERLRDDAARRLSRRSSTSTRASSTTSTPSTPEPSWRELNIGSRPARRRGGTGPASESLRAIPWQFAWTQTRLLLGVWLGVEEALERALARGERDLLRQMYREWPYFRSAIDLIEMVLAKADARIAAEYDRRLVPADLQPLGAELRGAPRSARSRACSAVTGHRELLEANPVLRRSIDVRNPVRRSDQPGAGRTAPPRACPRGSAVRAALMVTVNGIAAGMRNTG